MKVFIISHFISRLEKDDKAVAEWCHNIVTLYELPTCIEYVVWKYVICMYELRVQLQQHYLKRCDS